MVACRSILSATALLAVAASSVACAAAGTTMPEAPAATPTATGAPAPRSTAVLAFAGDVHFEGAAAAGITDGLGSAFSVLAAADAAVVNLETAITARGEPAPKEYTFRAPPQALSALREAGVDAVSLANNHGMDYGATGLTDTLAAGREAGLAIIGAGADAAAAFAPWRATLNGIDVAVLAATDVLDTSTIDDWTAGPDSAGLASAKDPQRLLGAVREQARQADVVAVMLHWGVERTVCPTDDQQELAALLAAAGADVVVGSHAHVLQPDATVGDAYVHYGLGNFVWYSSGGAGARTGVVTVTVDHDGVVATRWHPATITDGRPELDQEPPTQHAGSACPR